MPDYACPKTVVENIRLSKPNRSSVKPAGIREGDNVLPYRFERRDQPRFDINAKILRCDQVDPKVLHARANTADQFVVTGKSVGAVPDIMKVNQYFFIGPLPCLKGIGTSYMKFLQKRQCLQCPAKTYVGALFVHAKVKENRCDK